MSTPAHAHATAEAPTLDPDTEYLRLLPQLERLAPDPLLPINIDVMQLMTKVLGALPKLRALRSPIEAAFSSFDASLFDRIESYTVALLKAHAIYNLTAPKAPSVLPKVQQLRTIRRQLSSAARTLVDYGRIDGNELTRVGEKRGHGALISDVLLLTSVLKANWERIAGCTPLTRQTLVQAREQVLELMHALGRRKRPPPAFRQAVRIRQQLFTLVVGSYEEARHALRYVRARQRDADAIAPSPYSGRVGRAVKSAARRAELESIPSNPPLTTS